MLRLQMSKLVMLLPLKIIIASVQLFLMLGDCLYFVSPGHPKISHTFFDAHVTTKSIPVLIY